MSEFIILKSTDIIDIPASVATCPYCGGKLHAWLESWTEDENSEDLCTISDEGCHLDCQKIDEVEIDEYIDTHTYMPYVYWLPVENVVSKWIAKHYRWRL